MIRRWLGRMRALVRREGVEAEFDEELRYHLEREVERNIARGMSPEQAQRTARRAFGDIGAVKEEARDTWRWRLLDDLIQDVRLAGRSLWRSPGFAVVALLSLGFGIGATTTVFTVIDALDFRPLPYPDAERLVLVAEVAARDDPSCPGCPYPTSKQTASEWRSLSRSLDAMAWWTQGSVTLDAGDMTEQLPIAQVSPGFLDLLAVRPVIGRDLAPSDTVAGAEPVALLSHETWQTRFGGRRDVIGERVEYYANPTLADARTFTVVGVLPDGFHFKGEAEFWLAFPSGGGRGPGIGFTTVFARLGSGVSLDVAETELRAIGARLAETAVGQERRAVVLTPLREWLGWGAGKGRFALFGITTLVLLIAVMNVAGLLLARAVAKADDLTVRGALGASRIRLLRQLLVEGLTLGLAGGALGVLAAVGGVQAAGHWFRVERAGMGLEIDLRILAFSAGLAIVAGLLVAILPAIRASGADLYPSLRARRGSSAGVRTGRMHHGLMLAQIAAGLMLLTGAGMLAADFLKLRYLDLGFDPQHLYGGYLFGRDLFARAGPGGTPEAWRPEIEEVRERVRLVPGVAGVALVHSSAVAPAVVRPDGWKEASKARVQAIDVEWFEVFGTPILLGRGFTTDDRRGERAVAVINRAAAALFWPAEDPLGREVFVGDTAGAGEWLTVVGVIPDVEKGEMVERHWPVIYRPLAQAPIYHSAASLYVRLSQSGRGVLAAVQAEVRQGLGYPVTGFRSVDQQLQERLLPQRFNAAALNLFAAFAVLLAAMGIYGSVAFAVGRRTREIGIRMALGADTRSVLALVMHNALLLATGGILLGLGGAFVITRVLRPLVSATSTSDPRVFAGATVVIAIAIVAAAALPARRAARVDAAIALRGD